VTPDPPALPPQPQPQPPQSPPPLLPSLPANRALDQHLRRSLEVLRDQTDDATLRRRIDDVVAGRSSLRSLARDGAFGVMMQPLVERGLQQLDALTPEQRRDAEAGAAAFERGETPGEAPRPGPTHGTW
jgi:hypothetical protein